GPCGPHTSPSGEGGDLRGGTADRHRSLSTGYPDGGGARGGGGRPLPRGFKATTEWTLGNALPRMATFHLLSKRTPSREGSRLQPIQDPTGGAEYSRIRSDPTEEK